MLRGVLDDQEADVRMRGHVRLKMRDDQSREQSPVGEGVTLRLLGQRLRGKCLHSIGDEIPIHVSA
jgi:hypothetical protein